MPTYGWRWCPICRDNTHHTILRGAIICNAHHTEEELKALTERKRREISNGQDT